MAGNDLFVNGGAKEASILVKRTNKEPSRRGAPPISLERGLGGICRRTRRSL
jgi:hypothetical protein